MQIETKFNVGDRVTESGTNVTGSIVTLRFDSGSINQIIYRVHGEPPNDGVWLWRTEDELSVPKLTPEEAWVETALLVGIRIAVMFADGWSKIQEADAKDIRHECYVILGGNRVKVTEEVKGRVRGLIERAEKLVAAF